MLLNAREKRVHVLLFRLQLKKKNQCAMCFKRERTGKEEGSMRYAWDQVVWRQEAEWSDTSTGTQRFQTVTRSRVRGMARGMRFSSRVSEGMDPADILTSDFRSLELSENTLPSFSASQLVVICYGTPRQQIQELYYFFSWSNFLKWCVRARGCELM